MGPLLHEFMHKGLTCQHLFTSQVTHTITTYIDDMQNTAKHCTGTNGMH